MNMKYNNVHGNRWFLKGVIALVFIGFNINTLSAQQILEGYLVDKATRQPVSFAYIGISGNARYGTVSNEDGLFRLESDGIQNSDTLLITHINYVSLHLPVQLFLQSGNSKIQLTERVTELTEIQVKASEDYQAFEEVVKQTQKSLRFPMTANLYYRELVRENSSFNKFADGMLTVVYEKDGDKNDIRMRVDQCRTAKLPKDEDDQFELVSPVKMELVLGYEFANVLNRFQGDHKVDYHFYSFPEDTTTNQHLIVIEPKADADRSDNKLLYRAILLADRNNMLREVQIEKDSLCHFEKSLLALKYGIAQANTWLTFKEVNGINYLAFARVNFTMTFTTKKFTQTENFISEFLTLDVKPEATEIAKADVYKKSALYKHPTRYDAPFWKGINLPVLTEQEEKLILDLEKREKEKQPD